MKVCKVCYQNVKDEDIWECDVCKKSACADCVTWQQNSIDDVKTICTLCSEKEAQ